MVRLTVEDDGPGVPADGAARACSRSSTGSRGRPGRVAGRHRRRPGRRPGLVEATGGRVTAGRSALGGLAIRLRELRAPGTGRGVPAAEAPEASGRPMRRPDRPEASGCPGPRPPPRRPAWPPHRDDRPRPTRPARVLVVEDDRETRSALARELAGRGYRVVEAEDGRTALSRWEARRPDVVLLDLGLPDLDGLQGSVRRIRREAATPIVILSGRYRGAREGRGARARRRRLRDQAVRDRRAAGADPGRAAPRGRPRRRRRRAAWRPGPSSWTRGATRSTSWEHGASISRRASSRSCGSC